MSKILGIYLAKNEEFFTAWSLMNVVDFCDSILVLDNRSTDRTQQIARNIANKRGSIEIVEVSNANDTQKFLKPYFGTDTWVFGVDGDEIHDPTALLHLKSRIEAGDFKKYWALSSRYCHVTQFNIGKSICWGYTQPESKANVKLYNFNAIDNWISRWRKRERLHGPGRKFRPGFSEKSIYSFSTVGTWDDSQFRCLHLCFYPRSPIEYETQQQLSESFNRNNPAESRPLRRFTRSIAQLKSKRDDYKTKRYALGPLRQFNISAFGRPDNFRDVDSYCDNVMQLLSEQQFNFPL